LLVEKVIYSSSQPWPGGLANGQDGSIQRLNFSSYGNDPANWSAALPTAGLPTGGPGADSDGDGIPDDWELAHSLNPYDANDASLDADGDGMTNWEEYMAGT